MPLLGGIAVYSIFSPTTQHAALTELTEKVLPELALTESVHMPQDTVLAHTVEFVVRRNDTMERIFRQLQLSLDDLTAVRQLPEVQHALEILHPGEHITFVHTEGSLQELKRRIDATSVLEITRHAEGFKAELIETPLTTKIVLARGQVENSFFASASQVGLSDGTIMRLANIFGWDIDFALDIQQGDTFTAIYEQKYRTDGYVGDGTILAAEFTNNNHTYRAVHYASEDEKISNYFTPEGRSLHKQFLRAPVDFLRISSGFSNARRHPILNTIRAHRGVDYAAPTGTPIRAAGDGRISFVGKKGGYGNVIILEHGAGITTLYGHMSRFAKNMRAGLRVQQGQTIGFVGQTGAATGPHLHYEYRINGVHRNPRTVPLPDAAPIPHAYLADFHQQTDSLLMQLDRLAYSTVTAGPRSR